METKKLPKTISWSGMAPDVYLTSGITIKSEDGEGPNIALGNEIIKRYNNYEPSGRITPGLGSKARQEHHELTHKFDHVSHRNRAWCRRGRLDWTDEKVIFIDDRNGPILLSYDGKGKAD